jgi:hypothetical protein
MILRLQPLSAANGSCRHDAQAMNFRLVERAAACKRLKAQSHAGSVQLSSRRGTGALCWTWVPLCAAHRTHEPAPDDTHELLLERRLIACGSPEVTVQSRRKQELK